jgi:hypothetical protein
MIAYDRLSQIVPSDQALAAKAVATGLEQISGVMNMTLPVLANTVIGLQTVAPGSDIANLNATTGAVPSNVAANIADIAGTAGRPVVICDVLGLAAGYRVTANLTNTVATLGNTNVIYLTTVYQTMDSVVGNVYGDPVAGPVIIPSGQPAAGTYTAVTDGMGNVTINAAVAAFTGTGGDTPPTGPGLIPVAQIEIGNIANNSPAQVSVLNSNFTSMAAQIQQEQTLQTAAQIDFANLLPNNNSTVFSLISNLPTYGQQTEPGGQAEFWSGVADQSFTGQATVAALKEGVNLALLSEAGIQTNSTIPSTPGQT